MQGKRIDDHPVLDTSRENRDLKHYVDMLICKMLEADPTGAMLQGANAAYHKKWRV